MSSSLLLSLSLLSLLSLLLLLPLLSPDVLDWLGDGDRPRFLLPWVSAATSRSYC